MNWFHQLYSAWQHDRVLTASTVRQHFLEGCPRCTLLFQQTKDFRLVEAVKAGHLQTHVIVLCPTGRGKPQQFPSVIDVPDTLPCSCGNTHNVSMNDIDISFTVAHLL